MKQAANSQLVPGQSFAYGFDAMGNRTSTSAGTAPNVATSGYTPNALNQFPSITTPGKLDVLARSDSPASFQIDGQNIAATRVGNLHNAHANVANSPNGKQVSVSVTANGSTQSGSRWLAPASVSPSYDADGNLKQDGRWSYTWDGENRLTKLETLSSAITAGAPNLTISYTYDFRSRKLRETLHDGTTLTQDERTLYDGWNPVAEFKFHNSTFILHNSFLWGVDLSGTNQGAGGVGGLLAVRSATPVSGSSVFFPSYDTNGNIIAWSNESGQLIRRLDYDPFGNVLMKETFQGSSAELDQVLKHGFSTKPQNPESGLLYYGYRFYDPQLGRWLNRDPIEEEGGVNLYGFVGNDPNNGTDMLGLKTFLIGFYGAGSYEGFGNIWLAKIWADSGGSSGYLFNDGYDEKAIDKLFKEIDVDKNKEICAYEVENHTFKAVGYSWGGPTTTSLTNELYLEEGKKDKMVRGFKLHTSVVFKAIVTIDPVTILKGMKPANDNVKRWVNYHQHRRTGKMELFLAGKTYTILKFGNFASANFHGKNWSGKATIDIDVPVAWGSIIKTQIYDPKLPFIGLMPGSEVNHDTIPWFVYENAKNVLK